MRMKRFRIWSITIALQIATRAGGSSQRNVHKLLTTRAGKNLKNTLVKGLENGL